MGLIRFVQARNRNKELKGMRQLKEQELAIIENKEISDIVDLKGRRNGRNNHFHKRLLPLFYFKLSVKYICLNEYN